MDDQASYICDSCGEEIVIPLDLSAGATQVFVEDCPVCCCPNAIHIELDEGGGPRVWAERE
jgi:Cysteine-rich CPXCG